MPSIDNCNCNESYNKWIINLWHFGPNRIYNFHFLHLVHGPKPMADIHFPQSAVNTTVIWLLLQWFHVEITDHNYHYLIDSIKHNCRSMVDGGLIYFPHKWKLNICFRSTGSNVMQRLRLSHCIYWPISIRVLYAWERYFFWNFTQKYQFAY